MYEWPESTLDSALISVPKQIILRVYVGQGFTVPRILKPSGQLDVGLLTPWCQTGLGLQYHYVPVRLYVRTTLIMFQLTDEFC
jgi:hypothetical protein